ncbi:MAG: hypothetical protein R6V27_14490 [Balneolaceae bacterium]
MNLAMVTSYLVAGVLLLSIVMVNINTANSGAELTITKITRDKLETVTAMLDDDIPNMGYDLIQPPDTIITAADSTKIQFFRNLCRNPERDAAFVNCAEPERITWEFLPNSKPSSSRNDSHGTLIRVVEEAGQVPDTTRIESGVTNFHISYLNDHGKPLSDRISTPLSAAEIDDILQLYIELEVQSDERAPGRFNGSNRYIRAVWEKRFSPRNLEIEL